MASRFWVGGTGTWDTSTTHWAATSGGSSGASAPTSSDDVTFDGSSGGGTVTLASGTFSMLSFACGAFTGTIDSSVNNPTWNVGGNWSYSGSGTRTVKLGTSTINLSGNTSVFGGTTSTNLTFDNNSGCTVNFTATSTGTRGLVISSGMAAKSHGNITVSAISTSSGKGKFQVNTINTVAVLINSLSVTGPNYLEFPNNVTTTITNAGALNTGSSTGLVVWVPQVTGTACTVALASGCTATWSAFREITVSGNALTATNSFDIAGNTLITITGPTVGQIQRHPGFAGGFQ